MPVSHYIWDMVDDNVQLEADDEGNVFAAYESKPGMYGEANYQTRDGVTTTFHYDGNGSTRALTDENQEVTDTFAYSAFGATVERTGTTEAPYHFQGASGYQTDSETNQIYVRRRHYDPVEGRWLSVDPSGFIEGTNLYAAHFVPNRSDPSGEVSVSQLGEAREPNCRRFARTKKLEARQRFRFHLDGDWPCRTPIGFYIQHVRVHCFLCNCEDVPCSDERVEYWEAFQVSPTRQVRRPFVTDIAEFETNVRRSSYSQRGTIKFYCLAPEGTTEVSRRDGEILVDEVIRAPIGPVNPQDRCTTSSKKAPFVTDEPGFWKRPPVGSDGHRYFAVYWNCCCDESNQYGRVVVEPNA